MQSCGWLEKRKIEKLQQQNLLQASNTEVLLTELLLSVFYGLFNLIIITSVLIKSVPNVGVSGDEATLKYFIYFCGFNLQPKTQSDALLSCGWKLCEQHVVMMSRSEGQTAEDIISLCSRSLVTSFVCELTKSRKHFQSNSVPKQLLFLSYSLPSFTLSLDGFPFSPPPPSPHFCYQTDPLSCGSGSSLI